MFSLLSASLLAIQDGPVPPPEEVAPSSFGMWPAFVLIFAIFYFMMIRPEKKNRAKREEMLRQLKKGDKVITTSGMYGAVVQVQDDVVTLQIADGVRARFSVQAVQSLEGDVQPAKDAGKKEAEATA